MKRALLSGAVFGAVMILLPPVSHAQLDLVGGEFRVNTETAGPQAAPSVAGFVDGSFLVVWEGAATGDVDGIHAQRYDADGLPDGGPFQINTYTSQAQTAPFVIATAAGGFLVAWESRGQDGDNTGIFARGFGSDGVALGVETQVNVFATDIQRSPTVAQGADDTFLVVWESRTQDGDSFGVFGRTVDDAAQALLAAEFQVNTYTTSYQDKPRVATNPAGEFIVVWQSIGQDGSDRGVFGRRFDNLGSALGTEFQVNTYTTSRQYLPDVAPTGSGVIVVWTGADSSDGSGHGMFAKRLGATGTPAAPEFQLNSYTTSSQTRGRVQACDNGRFLVSWVDTGERDGDEDGVYARYFSVTGEPRTEDFQVNSYTSFYQRTPAVSLRPDCGFVVAWESAGSGGFGASSQDGDASGVYAQVVIDPLSLTTTTTTTTTTSTTLTTVSTSTSSTMSTTTTLQTTCGDAGGQAGVTATDALLALLSAVGAQFCELCVCDVDSNSAVTATDALNILQFSIGVPVTLNCPAC